MGRTVHFAEGENPHKSRPIFSNLRERVDLEGLVDAEAEMGVVQEAQVRGKVRVFDAGFALADQFVLQ